MKKGLLSLLAVALTVVSCQNYDDQFESLTQQITQLSTTVAGLTAITDQVTALQQTVNGLATASSLASLAGQVSDNATAIAAAGSSADAATAAVGTVSDQVASVQASITAILADLENVATAADLDTISATLAIVQADVKEILAGSAVINQDVTINNAATLEYVNTLIKTGDDDPNVIINGKVVINTTSFSPAITADQLAEVNVIASKFATILGDGLSGLSVTSNTPLTFTNLTFIDEDYTIVGVDQDDPALRTISGNLTSNQSGAIDYTQITSVGDVIIEVTNKNSITSIDFSNASVKSLKIGQTGVGSNMVDAPKATSIKTGTSSVTRIIGDSATTIIHANATSDLSSITITSLAADSQITVLATGLSILNVTGTQTTDLFATSLNGTSTITMANKIAEAHLTALDAADGTINATVVDLTDLVRSSGILTIAATNVDLTGYDATSGLGATTFTGKGAVTLTNMDNTVVANDITSLTVLSQEGSIAFPSSYAELSTLNFTGKAATVANPSTQSNSVTLSNLASLTTVSIDGSILELISSGNQKLTSFTTVDGSKVTSMTLAGATKLASVDLNHSFVEFQLANVVDVRNNPVLASIDLSAIGKVKTITIDGNAKLKSIIPPSTTLSEAGAPINVLVGVNSLTTAVWTPHTPKVAATQTSSEVAAIPAKLVSTSLHAIKTWVDLHSGHTTVNYDYDTSIVSGTTAYANYAALVAADALTFNTNSAIYGPASGTMDTATETKVIKAN